MKNGRGRRNAPCNSINGLPLAHFLPCERCRFGVIVGKDGSDPSLEHIWEIYNPFSPVLSHTGAMVTNPIEVTELLADHFVEIHHLVT